MRVAPTEKELDVALAKELESSSAFLAWFLSHTCFAMRSAAWSSCRSNYVWGKHPFSAVDPSTGKPADSTRESETDVLLIVKASDGEILALHIENKLASGSFTAHQPEMYRQRAAHWLNSPKHGSYTAFETVLVAPTAFRDRYRELADNFGCFVSHEAIAAHIPLFGAG